MSISDNKINPAANLANKAIDIGITPASSQNAVVAYATKPGYNFQVKKVEVYASAVANVTNVDVHISNTVAAGTSVLASPVAPVAGAVTAGTLSSTVANLKGSASQYLVVLYTSAASASATQLAVTVTFRPRPMDGEVY